MQYMVIFTPKERFIEDGQPADFWPRELEERRQAQVLYIEGSLRQVWALDTERHGAVVLFEADDTEHLERVIGTFPFVQLDYCEYRVLPLAPYPGFAPAGNPQKADA